MTRAFPMGVALTGLIGSYAAAIAVLYVSAYSEARAALTPLQWFSIEIFVAVGLWLVNRKAQYRKVLLLPAFLILFWDHIVLILLTAWMAFGYLH